MSAFTPDFKAGDGDSYPLVVEESFLAEAMQMTTANAIVVPSPMARHHRLRCIDIASLVLDEHSWGAASAAPQR
jgi:hypothetical protein